MFTRHKAEKRPPCGGKVGSFKIEIRSGGGTLRKAWFAQTGCLRSIPQRAFRSKTGWIMVVVSKTGFEKVVIFQAMSG